MESGTYDLQLVTNERYDRVFFWKETAYPHQAMSITSAWQVTMIIFSDDLVVGVSVGDTPDFSCVASTIVTGRIDLSIGSQFIANLISPYGSPSEYRYRIDLVDVNDETNVVPFVKGRVLVSKGYGP